jgi:hypothetical protein
MHLVARPLAAADLPAASRINRGAFSKFFGIPDPAKFRVDADVIGPRWRPRSGSRSIDGELAPSDDDALGQRVRPRPVTVAPELGRASR